MLNPFPAFFHCFLVSSLFIYSFSLTVSIEDLPYKDGHVVNNTLGPPLLLKTCVLQMPKELRDPVVCHPVPH